VTVVLLTLRFLLELALLAAMGVAGWRLAGATWAQAILVVTLPLVTAIVWGLVISPKARVQLPLAPRLVIELVLFATAAVLLWLADLTTWAVVLLGGELLVLGGLLASGQRPGRDQLPTAG
jgi:hypothetical protein